MWMSDVRPETIALLDTMAGRAPKGWTADEPVDVSWIDPLALGDLLTAARGTELWRGQVQLRTPAASVARAVLKVREKMEPLFRGSACRDYLELIASEADGEADKAADGISKYEWEDVCFALRRCIELSHDGLAAAAARLLSVSKPDVGRHAAVALARLVNAGCEARVLAQLAADFAQSPLLVGELRVAASLDLTANILLADLAFRYILAPEATTAEGRYRMSDCPPYPDFAEAGLKQAAERLRKIHAFETPYASDKAFTLEESAVIARLASVALDRDEAWLPPVLDELFRKVALAPTAAKTVPSQSVALGLGHAIEAFPTPEATTILREVIQNIRHAGVKKRLQRNLRGAERGLAARPEIALRLPLDQPLSKPQLTMVTRCLEGGLALGMTLDYQDWRVRLAERPEARALTASLVWRFLAPDGGVIAALAILDGERLALQDVAGEAVAPAPACRVTLWHPSDATAAEREAWRDRLQALAIRQPFKQVFREHYVAPSDEKADSETAIFAGHVVMVIPFLGVARRERWELRRSLPDARLRPMDGETASRRRHLSRLFRGNDHRKSQRVGVRRKQADHAPRAAGGDLVRNHARRRSSGQHRRLRGDERAMPSQATSAFCGASPKTRSAPWPRPANRPSNACCAVSTASRSTPAICGSALTRSIWRQAASRATESLSNSICRRTAKRAARPWLPYDEKLLEKIYWTAIEIAVRAPSEPAP